MKKKKEHTIETVVEEGGGGKGRVRKEEGENRLILSLSI